MARRKADTGFFGLDLPPTIETLTRRFELTHGQPIEQKNVRSHTVAKCLGYFSNDGFPVIESHGKPSLEEVVLELLRLHLRRGEPEKLMPYAEMVHENNRILCTRLYRLMEAELLFADAECHGIRVRDFLVQQLTAELLDELGNGSYRSKDAEPMRSRHAVLDGLELMMADINVESARHVIRKVAEIDDRIAGPMGLVWTLIGNYRPFDSIMSARKAYYIALPFLFETSAAFSRRRRGTKVSIT